MNPFSNIFSTLLSNFGQAASGGQSPSMISQLMQPSGGSAGVNPFGDILGLASSMVGGPMSKQGTASSLPGELLKGMEGIITGDDIIKDTLGLAKPVEALGMKGLGGMSNILGNLNPFGGGAAGGQGGESGFGEIARGWGTAALPLGLGVAIGFLEDSQKKEREKELARSRR